jgi:hypothetical protein
MRRVQPNPELRSLASGSSVATFAVATNEFRSKSKEHAECQYNRKGLSYGTASLDAAARLAAR